MRGQMRVRARAWFFRRFFAGVFFGEFILQTCGTNSTLFISQLEVTLLVFRACVRAIFVGTFSWFFVFALSTFVFL